MVFAVGYFICWTLGLITNVMFQEETWPDWLPWSHNAWPSKFGEVGDSMAVFVLVALVYAVNNNQEKHE